MEMDSIEQQTFSELLAMSVCKYSFKYSSYHFRNISIKPEIPIKLCNEEQKVNYILFKKGKSCILQDFFYLEILNGC